MTKKLIFIIFFVIMIGVAGFLESRYIIDSFNYLERELIKIENQLSQDKENISSEYNVSSIESLHETWQGKTKVLKFFVWHTGIKDVEVGLSRITSYTEENDYTEAHVELQNLIDYCQHYSQDYRFSLQNVI